jgi:hypothetical protein
MPPWSVAAPLAGLFPGTSSVPATFLESVPSLKLTLVSQLTSRASCSSLAVVRLLSQIPMPTGAGQISWKPICERRHPETYCTRQSAAPRDWVVTIHWEASQYLKTPFWGWPI